MYKRKGRFFDILIILVLIGSIVVGCGQGNTVTVNKEVGSGAASKSIPNLNGENIQQINIMNTIKEFISEKYKGRLAGSKENQLASQYIADYFKKIELDNPMGLENYMQYYQQPIVKLKDKPVLQIMDENGEVDIDFNYPENFVLRRLSSETNTVDIEAPMYLIENTEDLLNENDGRFEGKVILIPFKFYYLLGHQNAPADYAKSCGALFAISEFDLDNNKLGFVDLKVSTLTGSWMKSESYKPFTFVDSDTFSKLAKAAKSGNKMHFSCSSEVNINGVAANIIGLIPGSDPKLKDNYIIIGAHFDHVGDNMNGTYNPGALDNASGVAAMMEIARVIRESKIQPKQSILFIAFNGESGGFFGSSYYCKNPIYPLDKAVMINLDMIGSAAKIPLTIATASSKSNTSLSDTLTTYADELSIDYNKQYEAGSDHVVFDNKGVPSVLLINLDFKSGYHTPYDTIEVVDGDRIKEITKLVLYYVDKQAY